MSEKRRENRRYPSRLHANMVVGTDSYNVRLLDQSPNGLGIFLPLGAALTVGQAVRLEMSDTETLEAVVCHFHPHPLGGLLVGLQCDMPPQESVTT